MAPLAVIIQTDQGYAARFERLLPQKAAQVWAALTEDAALAVWMPNLKTGELGSGGSMLFDMKDGTSPLIEMSITDFVQGEVLEFEWGAGRVRFHVQPVAEGTRLELLEYVGEWTAHTPKDLAGWHVCLDLLANQLADEPRTFPQEEWEQWYEAYQAISKGL
ncbi:SRPBCC family protein [Paenibacillus whitsoniae]|uniref:SRPBCC family protein n=1 Tax=Paenibacillus whitsoniae TaxID=2496558 RepID=A0A3S0I8D3_9BACL|nr:SRPBCC family protein [Paenibacillus whitsoniae]RTE06471.1 SRPBCC family protein [Paenibacillus whitsoniae]